MKKYKYTGAVVVVKWSAYSPSTPTIWVRILVTPTVFSVKFVFEKNENKQKEAGVGPFKKLDRTPLFAWAVLTQAKSASIKSRKWRLFVNLIIS